MKLRLSQIEQIDINIKAEGESALSMRLQRDGTLCRQGNGAVPPVKISAMGMTDGAIFRELIALLDERILELPSLYDHPDKSGLPVTYEIVFAGPVTGRKWLFFPQRAIKGFRFSMGTESKDTGDLLSFFDAFIIRAVELTDAWYAAASSKAR